MMRYVREFAAISGQLFMFYIFPLFAGPTDAMGMVFLILLATLLISLVLGLLSGNRVKFLYPLAAAVAFIPSVFIYYNESALVHAAWYLAVALVGMLTGAALRWVISKVMKKAN